MKKGVGITERGDAGLDFSWKDKLDNHLFSILITKSINDKFIDEVKNLKNIIVHATITGYGGTKLEPNVINYGESLLQIKKLIENGFDSNKIVVRIDPIFETKKGRIVVELVLDEIIKLNLPVKRIRYSYVDMYNHVKKRFIEANLKLPEFTEKNFMRDLIVDYPQFIFESCAEGLETDIGCISDLDFELFGINHDAIGINPQNRKHCKCLSCKVELLNNKKRCPHQCLYCYWVD